MHSGPPALPSTPPDLTPAHLLAMLLPAVHAPQASSHGIPAWTSPPRCFISILSQGEFLPTLLSRRNTLWVVILSLPKAACGSQLHVFCEPEATSQASLGAPESRCVLTPTAQSHFLSFQRKCVEGVLTLSSLLLSVHVHFSSELRSLFYFEHLKLTLSVSILTSLMDSRWVSRLPVSSSGYAFYFPCFSTLVSQSSLD